MRRVKSRGSSSVMVVDGRLAGLEAKNLHIDTGADYEKTTYLRLPILGTILTYIHGRGPSHLFIS